MKITRKSKRSRYIWIVSILTIATLSIGVFFIINDSDSGSGDGNGPEIDTQERNRSEEDTSRDQDIDTNIDRSPDNTPDTHNDDNSSDLNPNTADDEGEFTPPPIQDEASTNAPYPIENSRYRIDQTSNNTFSVTLYPIVGSGTGYDYNGQLRQYKSEAMQYLESRHGNTSNLTINWTPAEAENV